MEYETKHNIAECVYMRTYCEVFNIQLQLLLQLGQQLRVKQLQLEIKRAALTGCTYIL